MFRIDYTFTFDSCPKETLILCLVDEDTTENIPSLNSEVFFISKICGIGQ